MLFMYFCHMNELNKDLKGQAISLGLCQQWTDMWSGDWSQQKLIERMYKGIDFCLKHHWPSNEYIKGHFGKDLLRSNNIFVDDKMSTLNPQKSLSLGSSDVTYRYNTNSHGIIHIRDNSAVKVIAKNRSFVIVHLFENAYITAERHDIAKLVIVKHSEDVTIVADKDVIIKEEYDYLKSKFS